MSDKKTVMRGVKIKLSPSPEQAAIMDRWRRNARALWNLLLGMEQAAYNGEKFRPELGWRRTWAEVTRSNYENAADAWVNGKRRKDGSLKKAPGEGKEPVEPTAERYVRISGRRVEGQAPGLFLWGDELKKIMARLKGHPLTSWISDLPSHSAQAICDDLDAALKAMLREKRKRAKYGAGLNTGFPRFKKSRYASGSVYIVNNQTIFDCCERTVTFPKMKEPVIFRQERIPDGKLLASRIWRQGEQWWMSCQFEIEAPKARPKNGRECGLKISAGVLATVFDGERIEQSEGPVHDRKLERRLKLAGRRMSRRSRKTRDYYETADEIATLNAKERNRRDDALHKISRKIVNRFEVITVHKMEVSGLMERSRVDTETGEVKRVPKGLVKANKRAAMAKLRGYVSYKAVDEGGTLNETHKNFPEVQKCSVCGKLHYMPLEKRTLSCDCGNVMDRRHNAAVNEFQMGRVAKAASALL
jgi:putative transposase